MLTTFHLASLGAVSVHADRSHAYFARRGRGEDDSLLWSVLLHFLDTALVH